MSPSLPLNVLWPGRGGALSTSLVQLVDNITHIPKEEDKERWAQLEPFLAKVQRFTRHLKMQMDAAKTSRATSDTKEKASESAKQQKKGKSKRALDEPVLPRSSKRAKTGEAAAKELEANSDNASGESSTFPVFTQSVLVTGTKLKPYQLEGVAWMFGLYSQGISGILGECCPHTFSDIVGSQTYSG